MKILIIEDNDISAKVLTKMLDSLKIEIDLYRVSNTKDSETILNSIEMDLIFFDNNLGRDLGAGDKMVCKIERGMYKTDQRKALQVSISDSPCKEGYDMVIGKKFKMPQIKKRVGKQKGKCTQNHLTLNSKWKLINQ